jgi:hypothetical protein
MTFEITTALTAIKGMKDIVSGFSTLKTEQAVLEVKANLNEKIFLISQNMLELQTAYFGLLEEKNSLEKKLKDVKEWEKIKQEYALAEVSVGARVYRKLGEDNIWFCTHCFSENHLSILQVVNPINIPNHAYTCPRCQSEISIKNINFRMPTVTSTSFSR